MGPMVYHRKSGDLMVNNGESWDDNGIYPLVNYIAIEMVIEIVDLPINSMVIFHSYVNVYQRVPPKWQCK